MEESAQRKERLKAMRMEASRGAATHNGGSDHSAVSLSNPLVESTANSNTQGHTFAQSFNYYTDPMAAYSGNKQSSKVSPQISQDYSSTPQRPWTNEMYPLPSFQPHINHPPRPQMQQPHGQYVNPSYAYTSNRPQSGNFPNPNIDYQNMSWNRNSPRPGSYDGPGSVGYPSPQSHFTSGPAHGSGQGGYPSPRFTNSPGNGSGQGYRMPAPQFRNSSHYGPGQGGYPTSSNQGRGQWRGNNMSQDPSYGRGKGQWSGPRGGRGRGRGRGGAHDHVSAEDEPGLFFHKSMVEDPWKSLEPVVWKSQKQQWFPHSVNSKKPRVSEPPRQQQQSSSQPSLAEMLAASFNEATNDGSNKE
uniref:protein SICKLE n=1 Tax=Erigeron canadensis TaxID=72917 RepID=UPI001CB90C30|nr:protein SICKLE [Erigeron canadensis]XP_043628655.1 protein SICKLE [Erigeron canadensis]